MTSWKISLHALLGRKVMLSKRTIFWWQIIGNASVTIRESSQKHKMNFSHFWKLVYFWIQFSAQAKIRKQRAVEWSYFKKFHIGNVENNMNSKSIYSYWGFMYVRLSFESSMDKKKCQIFLYERENCDICLFFWTEK